MPASMQVTVCRMSVWEFVYFSLVCKTGGFFYTLSEFQHGGIGAVGSGGSGFGSGFSAGLVCLY